MNILFQPFPDTVRVNGKDYEIVTDFREWIKLSGLLERIERYDRRTLNMVLDWYVDDRPEDEESAVYALQEFLAANAIYPDEYEDSSAEKREDEKSAPVKESFSFEQDAICIYSAFLEVYGIDIETIPYMHWWKFLVLFAGLPSNTEIKERMYYRTVDLSGIDDKEERKRIMKIRKKIAIRKHRRKMNDYQIGDMFG